MNGYLPQTACTTEQYHCNFQQIDHHTTRLLNSDEARKVTGQMYGIYGMLKILPSEFWKAANHLRIFGNGKLGAWELLCEFTNTTSATLRKALKWMDEQGVIKYWARRNGAGISIYFNLAINSVRQRAEQKNLRLVPASSNHLPTSAPEVPLSEDKVFRENLDSDLDATRVEQSTPTAEKPSDVVATPAAVPDVAAPVAPTKPTLQLVPPVLPTPSTELRLAVVEALTRQFAGLETLVREAMRAMVTREWLQKAGLPQASRVAAETALRVIEGKKAKPALDVGASAPELAADAIAEYEATLRENAWKDNALRALPPDEYARRIAAIEQAASSDPSYGTLHRWTDEARRAHFDTLLKKQLWEAKR